MKKEDIIIATKDKTVASKEEVTMIAVNNLYKRRPFYLSPVYSDEIGDYVYGLGEISRAQLNVLAMLPDYTSQLQIRNMERLTLQRNKAGEYILSKDFVKWNLALVQKEVAHSKQEVGTSIHFFYINNIEAEAKVSVDTKKTAIKAAAKLADLNDEDMSDLLYFFGYNPRQMSLLVRESTAYGLVDDRSADVLAYFTNDTESKHITFVKKLLAADLIKKDANGLITSSLGTLGYQEAGAAAFLYDATNDKIFDSLYQALMAKK